MEITEFLKLINDGTTIKNLQISPSTERYEI